MKVLRGLGVLGMIIGAFLLAFWILGTLRQDRITVPLLGNKIAVVDIKGVIEDSEETVRWLKAFGEDREVKAIILRIDSPGGAVGATQEIYAQVLRVKEDKVVVASLGNVAVSGAYYVACAADRIISNPGTVTGSIGVVMYFADFEGLMRKVGIRGHVVKSGRYKDMGSPFRDMTPEEKEILEGVIKDVHEQFIEVVATSRGLPIEEVREIADGRIFSGRQALKLGLVDRLGGFEDAVRVAKELAGIRGRPHLVYGRKEKGLLRRLLEGLGRETVGGLLRRSPALFFLFEP